MVEHKEYSEYNEHNTVFLGTKKPVPSKKKYSKTEQTAKNQKLDNSTEPDKLKTFEKDFIQQVVQARVQKGWNRKDLSVHLGVSEKDVTEFETGKMQYSGPFKARLKRLLGV